VGFIRSDEAGLVQALGRISDIDRSACRQHVERNFSVQDMVAKHIDLYERTIEGVSRSSDLLVTGAA